MILLGAALIAIGSTEVLVGYASGKVVLIIGVLLVLIALWRVRVRASQTLLQPSANAHYQTYAHIDEILDRLEDLSQQRNWDIDKRFEVARMACENPAATIDELERLFDEGHRSSFDDPVASMPEKGVSK